MKRRAFSFAEVITAVAVLAVLVGCAAIAVAGMTARIDGEAEELANWLTEHITRAQAEESSFLLDISQRTGSGAYMAITWLDGRSKGERDAYANDRVFMYDRAAVRFRTYDGGWQTLTPALTVCVMRTPQAREKLYVKVSGEGQVNVTTSGED